MNHSESATKFAKRVSGASAGSEGTQGATGYRRAENAAKRVSGALRGGFEHESFDVAARRHHSPDALRRRRYANAVLVLAYAAVAAMVYGAYTQLGPLQ